MALAVAAAVSLMMAGCGGSTGNGRVSGTAVKGPVNGGTMTAFAITNGAKGRQLGTATTDGSGGFTVDIGNYGGPVLMEMRGGAYTDEATGATTSMASGDVMRAVVPSVAAGSATTGLDVTPLTSMAQAWAQAMAGGMTDANIAAANGAVGGYFMVNDVLHTMPMDPLAQGSGAGATQDAKNYGMVIAGLTQYAHTLGMTSSSGIVTAMMDDASDGVLNGMVGATPIAMAGMGGMTGGKMPPTAGTSSLATAMVQFMTSSMNKSGLAPADCQSLLDRLDGSNGQLSTTSPGATGTTLSGKAFLGPVHGATLTAFAVTNGGKGAQLGTTTADAQGSFTMSLGSYAGPVLVEATGATYTDEATSSVMTMGSGDMMTAVVPTVVAGSATSGVMVTPLTSMAQARAQAMQGGMTDANVAAADGAVGSYFLVTDILHTVPVDPAAQGSGAGATQDAKDYGMVVAAMSQYARTVGMTTSSGIVVVMMSDASDGVMDGMMDGTPISMAGVGGMMGSTMMQATAGTSSLAAAMTQFAGSSSNKSGVQMADVQALVDKLNASNGTLH